MPESLLKSEMTAMQKQRAMTQLTKMNGLGNKILVADMRDQNVHIVAAAAIELASHDETSFDQIMAIYNSRISTTDYYIEIWNSDGSKAKACGNGTRCVVEWLYNQNGQSHFILETDGGIVEASRLENGLVSVNMGKARLNWQDIPTQYAVNDTNHVAIGTGPLQDASLVSMGNPHAIYIVDKDVWDYPLGDLGPIIEHDALFPERINISIVEITSPTSFNMRTFERGAGLTLACGTGACAAAVAANRRGLIGKRAVATLPGGDLELFWQDDGNVLMTGPTQYEFSGYFDPLSGQFIKNEANLKIERVNA